MTDVDWITEAISTAFLLKPGDDASGKGPSRIAWQEPVPVIDAVATQRNASNEQQIRAWAENLKLLRKKETFVASEFKQGGETLRAMRDLVQEQAASEKALEQLGRQVWADLGAVKLAVSQVRAKLQVRPGGGGGGRQHGKGGGDGGQEEEGQAVMELASVIDRADAALGVFKKQQAAAFRALMDQEQKLDLELEDAASLVMAIEDGMRGPLRRQSVTAQRSTPPPAGRGQQRQQALAAAGSDEDEEGSDEEDERVMPDQRMSVQRRRTGGGTSAGGARVTGGRGGCLAPEVAEFDDFVLRSGGEAGGWDKEDHEEFVRIVKACGGDYTRAVEVCMDGCVGFSRSEVIAHASWHMDYMDLMVKKRGALQRWREERDRAKAKAQAASALLDCETANEAAQEHRDAERAGVSTIREHQVRKEMVQAWKMQREEEQRRKEAEAAEERRRAEERWRIEKEERQMVNKMKIEVHREAKERAERLARMRAEVRAAAAAAAPPPVDPVKAWRVNERNSELLRRRQVLVAEKEARQNARKEAQAKLLEKVQESRARGQGQGGGGGGGGGAGGDPSRVYRGTSAHMARVQGRMEGKKEVKDSGFILKVSHLATPSWRAGV